MLETLTKLNIKPKIYMDEHFVLKNQCKTLFSNNQYLHVLSMTDSPNNGIITLPLGPVGVIFNNFVTVWEIICPRLIQYLYGTVYN